MSVTTVLDSTNDLVEQAKRVLPGGSFGNMPAEVVLREGRGGRIWDEAGREYVDFLLGSGPMYVGHAHPEVTAAVQAQVPLGTTFFGNNRHGIALAEAILRLNRVVHAPYYALFLVGPAANAIEIWWDSRRRTAAAPTAGHPLPAESAVRQTPALSAAGQPARPA